MNPWRILAPLFASVAVFALGMWVGSGLTASSWKSKLLRAAQENTQIIDAKNGELEQCRAEVTKFNETTAKNAAKTQQIIVADQSERKAAEKRATVREQESQRRLEAAFQTLDELRRLINEGAFQGCAAEHVGDDLVRMLNDAIAAGDGAGRDGSLPGTEADN